MSESAVPQGSGEEQVQNTSDVQAALDSDDYSNLPVESVAPTLDERLEDVKAAGVNIGAETLDLVKSEVETKNLTAADFVPSLARTVVPLIYALAIKYGLTQLPFGLGDAVTEDAITAALTGALYSAIRWAEHRWPSFGWLLGAAKKPTYTS